MKVRSFLTLAILMGSCAGLLVSQLWRHVDVLPIATPGEFLPIGSGFFFRQDAVLANHVGKNHDRVKEPFRTVVSAADAGTIRVRRNGEQLALGCIIDSEGLILTKLSELRGPLRCALPGGREYPATIVAKSPNLDLAILRIDVRGLTPVNFSNDPTPPGSWVAMSGGTGDVPLAVGIVGSSVYEVPAERAVLGVLLAESTHGPRIDHVVESSMADRIGLKPGDLLVGINDRSFRLSQDLIQFVATLHPGDRVMLHFRRDGKQRTVRARLGQISELVSEESEMEAELGRGLSVRRSGFPQVLQHDCVLLQNQCGGPLVNVEGRVVGVNIARAGRIASLALPSRVIVQVLPGLLAQAKSARIHASAPIPATPNVPND